MVFAGSAIQAQSVVYLSNSGNDSNIGSPDAPCKTLAAAYGKVYAGGRIVVMDSMQLDPITLSKAVTIDGCGKGVILGDEAGVSRPYHAVAVAAGASDRVVLQNLTLECRSGQTDEGVLFSSGKSLVIERCTFDGFTDAAVNVSVSNAAEVQIEDTTFTGSSMGVRFLGNSASVKFSLNRVRALGMGSTGFSLAGPGNSVLKDCEATGASYGLVVYKGDVQADGLSASQNGCGIQLNSGSLRLGDCVVAGNGTGVKVNGGALSSYGNNRVDGNGSGNGPFTTIGLK
jgi:hypothetical protein